MALSADENNKLTCLLLRASAALAKSDTTDEHHDLVVEIADAVELLERSKDRVIEGEVLVVVEGASER